MVSRDGVAPDVRLRVYQHHVFATLTAALEAIYPVVCRLVDERFFDYAASHYIRTRPPSAPCLFEYGDGFPDFLAAFDPRRQLVYLPDVARLEWALNGATHAEDAAPLDPAMLSAMLEEDYPRLVLQLDSSLSLLSSPWPIDQIWCANQPDADPDPTVDLASGGVTLQVRRVGAAAVFRPLDGATFAFRLALSEGRCLEAAATDALDADPDFDLTRALRSLFGDHVLTGYALSATGDEPRD